MFGEFRQLPPST